MNVTGREAPENVQPMKRAGKKNACNRRVTGGKRWKQSLVPTEFKREHRRSLKSYQQISLYLSLKFLCRAKCLLLHHCNIPGQTNQHLELAA